MLHVRRELHPFVARVQHRVGSATLSALLGAVMCVAPGVTQAEPETDWNRSPDPYAPYGRCLSSGSALGNKLWGIDSLGEVSSGVIAIKVLRCVPYSGGGGFRKVPCPDGSPYAYCSHNDNDGLGNEVTFGVLRQDATTDPNAEPQGCPGGKAASKLEIVKSAGRDPRRLTGIVTLACTLSAPMKAEPVAARVAACPTRSDPYGYCVQTANDGTGHAVTLGVVAAKDPGDPYALYGECNPVQTKPGFVAKSAVLQQLGLSLENVRTVDMIGCNIPIGYGAGWPLDLHAGSCMGLKWLPARPQERYDYCVWGTDERNNGVLMGVSGR